MKLTLADISQALFRDGRLVGTEHASDSWNAHTQGLWNLADYLRNRPEEVEVPRNAHFGMVAAAVGKTLKASGLPAFKPVRRNIAQGLVALREHRNERFNADIITT